LIDRLIPPPLQEVEATVLTVEAEEEDRDLVQGLRPVS
jgi:hypothetical protein